MERRLFLVITALILVWIPFAWSSSIASIAFRKLPFPRFASFASSSPSMLTQTLSAPLSASRCWRTKKPFVTTSHAIPFART